MPKHPRHLTEWFGFPVGVNTDEASSIRQSYQCPFVSGRPRCIKRTRLLPHPFGVCSVAYAPHGVLALCPYRFLEGHKVFRDIAQDYFGTLENLLLFAEVRIPGVGHLGRFDYVLVRHAPLSNEIVDFVAVEFQAAQTTSTGHLVQAVKDYLEEGKVKSYYPFGINWADIWKRSLIQALLKGMAVEKWQTAIYWVVQSPVYANLARRYGLPLPGEATSSDGAVRFALYDLVEEQDTIRLQGPQWLRFSSNALFHALQHQVRLPARDRILQHLQGLLQRPALLLRW